MDGCLAFLRVISAGEDNPCLADVPGFYQPCCRRMFPFVSTKGRGVFASFSGVQKFQILLLLNFLCLSKNFRWVFLNLFAFLFFSPQAWSLLKQDLLLPDLHRSGYWRPAYGEAAVGKRHLLQLVRLVDSFYIWHPENQNEVRGNSEKVTCFDCYKLYYF